MNHEFFSSMPRDPFEGDPNDPASFLEPDEPFAPLTDEERREVIEDLATVRLFRATLAPEGLEGICMLCEDCGNEHYYNWDILENHYLMLLDGQESPVHEPQFDPNPDRYAPWEYCAGFVDGLRARQRRTGGF